SLFFSFTSLSTSVISTLSLHDALPIYNDFYGQLEFSQANYEAEENGTNITITVMRKGGIAGTVSVDFSVSDGTATLDADNTTNRSEEHTSELQSLAYLVCRLLLEKKKI